MATPVPATMVAMPVLPLSHVPPGVASVSVVVSPGHTLSVPLMAAGKGFTVTTVVVMQPVANVYVITAVPAAMPVTTPVDGATVATSRLPLLHVPPGMVLLSVVVAPSHTLATPVDEGVGFTVSTRVE